jgi:DNA helicase-2/ATP-dependent DNA helicase PcrA
MATLDDSLLADLTDAQRQAVAHRAGPILVLAGPGSGKTTVVTRRVAYLIARGVPSRQILALTFTNKAAGEMRDRIDGLLPGRLGGQGSPTVATFHSFCARQLRHHADAAGLPVRYSIYDEADQREAIKQALQDVGLSSRNWSPASVSAAISEAKNRLLDAEAYAAEASDFYGRSVARIYKTYESILRANDALDFDDLLLRMAELLRRSEHVRQRLQERYRYLLIDEYQDTNHAQFIIAHTLAAAHSNICVVGDPDQSIYGWRGADLSNILEFEEHYPDAVIVPLGQNFRSTGHIVEAAAGLIRHNRRRKHKHLHTELGEGERPTVSVCRDEHHEASQVADCLRRECDERGAAWREMAVLYRINALSRVLEAALRDARIPYVIARGTAFYERKEIKEALSYLRLLANPHDEVSLRRIVNTPARGIGRTTLTKIDLFAIDGQHRLFEALRRADEIGGLSPRAVKAVGRFVELIEGLRQAAAAPAAGPDSSPLAKLVERVIRESGLEAMYREAASDEERQRLENLDELISAAAEFVPPETPAVDDDRVAPAQLDGLTAFLESIALVSDADMIDPERGAVTLMTLHAAKGLEFSVVAMVGLEEGLLPHVRSADNDAELEEERRLCFVGMTRAKHRLLLSRAGQRTRRGLCERTMGSRFLAELPRESILLSDQSDDVEPDTEDGVTRLARGLNRAAGEAIAFPVGCIVRHPKFGLGRVEAVTPRAAGASARVAFPTAGTKTLILGYAPLERVE